MSNPEFLIHIYAQFLHKHDGNPIHGKAYTVRLFDKDPITDDFLGEKSFDADGKVHFMIDPQQYRTEDSLRETKPDLYLVLLKEGQEKFRTQVASDINFKTEGNFNFVDGEWINLGTFLIEG